MTAKNIAFDVATLTVRTGAQVTVNFTNNDDQVPHDFGVGVVGVPHTNTCSTAGCGGSITFTAPAPANYTFQCTIHPTMVGTLVVTS